MHENALITQSNMMLAVRYTPWEWDAFVTGVKQGNFDDVDELS